MQEIGSERPASAASYHVRCKLDSRKYSAIFATSEMDKVCLESLSTKHNLVYLIVFFS